MDKDQISGRGQPADPEDDDPTLDIVRQLIEASEAVPAPALKPKGPATPRPGAAPTAPQAPAPAPALAPQAMVRPDVDPEPWALDSDDFDEDFDEAFDADAPSDGYRIMDADGEEFEDGSEQAPRRESVTGRLIGSLVRLLGRGLSALGRLSLAGLAWAWARVARFLRRPDAPRRLAMAVLVVALVAWPFELAKLTLLVPLAIAIAWASVGSDGLVELVINWFERLKQRDPDKAERLRARAAATTRLLNRGLEKLPERWTRGLYLPDFETDGYVPEKLMVDPFEELAARVQAAKQNGGRA